MPDSDTEPSTPEPVLVGYLVSIVLAVVAAFGVDASNELVGQAAAAVAGLIAVGVSAWVTRGRVTPVAKADAAVAEARAEEAAAASTWIAAAETGRPPGSPGLELLLASVKDLGRVEPVAPPPPPPDQTPVWEPRPPIGGL